MAAPLTSVRGEQSNAREAGAEATEVCRVTGHDRRIEQGCEGHDRSIDGELAVDALL